MQTLETPGWRVRKNEAGREYGRLMVLRFAYTTNTGHAVWECRCACGNEVEVSGGHLRSGHVRSCGCLQKEIAAGNMRAAQKVSVEQRRAQ